MEQLDELFSFLHDPREDVRQLAVNNVAGLTKSPELIPFFAKNDGKVVKDLMAMRKDHPLIAHDSISALVNLSTYDEILPFLDDEMFVFSVVLTIVIPNSVLADLCCMLLNNMTKHAPIAKRLIPPEPDGAAPASPAATAPAAAKAAGTAADAAPAKKQKNPADRQPPRILSTRDFLSGVFANVSALSAGARSLRQRSAIDGTIRLSKLLPFTDHPSAIRRGGAIAAIKNCCFDVEADATTSSTTTATTTTSTNDRGLLLSPELNLLPYVLLPLADGRDDDDLTDDERSQLPDELQFVEPERRREADARLRRMLVETLLLLAHTRPGRELLRRRRVYPVVRNMHRVEADEGVADCAERLVNLLMRDEPEDGEVAEAEVAALGKETKGSVPSAGPKKRAVVQEVVDSDDDEDGEDAGGVDVSAII
ncbi:hypothetical protein DFJ73DRAFT_797526 [Zopfochytrium polystomum]|nr:hypothetical protein DFJ73DRAFT_797526 [Zopfochytrium polystomum]